MLSIPFFRRPGQRCCKTVSLRTHFEGAPLSLPGYPGLAQASEMWAWILIQRLLKKDPRFVSTCTRETLFQLARSRQSHNKGCEPTQKGQPEEQNLQSLVRRGEQVLKECKVQPESEDRPWLRRKAGSWEKRWWGVLASGRAEAWWILCLGVDARQAGVVCFGRM